MAESKGLPMTAKWDPEKLQQEVEALQELETKSFPVRAVGYIKRSGPGLLQSAMTLGAGSAAASVMAGASFGYKLLWVQPVAMFLGVCMLAALGNITLSTGERAYRGFGRELSYTLAFLWAFGTIAASMIWHIPQYGLAAASARDLADLFGATVSTTNAAGEMSFTPIGIAVSWLVGFLILGINIVVTWNYGKGSKGIKTYEWFLRGVIALVIISFGIVVVANIGNIQWKELGKGFIGYYGIPEGDDSMILVLGMLGAAVGINMTFLYPYSLMAKGWGKAHKTLSRWDLGMSMFLPFVMVTSLMIVAMSVAGVYDPTNEGVRTGMSPLNASAALTTVMGANLGRIIFDLGFIGMTMGAISVHMVVCGFTVCEMFGLEYTTTRYRLFTLVPAFGVFGVVLPMAMWMPIFASAICFVLLPIAYLMFFVLNNNRGYIGDAVGGAFKEGSTFSKFLAIVRREIFNLILLTAIVVATTGSAIGIYRKVIVPLTKKPAAPAVVQQPEQAGALPAEKAPAEPEAPAEEKE